MAGSATVDDTARIEASRESGGAVDLRIGGRLDAANVADVWQRAQRALERWRPAVAVVHAGEVTYCDSIGAAMLLHLREIQGGHGGRLQIVDFPEDYQPILDLLLAEPPAPRDRPVRTTWVENVGEQSVRLLQDLVSLISYAGEMVRALGYAGLRPRSVRWKDMLRACQTAGVNSFPVVALVTFLLGLVLGFQSALQLRQFGADIFLANLIGLSLVRELAPLMTAVVLTARSGSAFAAELGTMKINEEVDALTTMGIDPVRFLVTPRVIAAVVMMPLLTMFANLAGLLGGAVVWVSTLDFAIPAYVSQLQQAVELVDFLGGLVKAFVFGILVASVGCIRGMQTRGGASAVGESTTSAVVSGIVLIALADSVFSILFHYLGI